MPGIFGPGEARNVEQRSTLRASRVVVHPQRTQFIARLSPTIASG
jgi:hypothetical protein